MRRNRFLPVLLWIACFAPAALGQGFTAETICNAGTVSVDAYVMLEGKLTEKSIAPADCAQAAGTYAHSRARCSACGPCPSRT